MPYHRFKVGQTPVRHTTRRAESPPLPGTLTGRERALTLGRVRLANLVCLPERSHSTRRNHVGRVVLRLFWRSFRPSAAHWQMPWLTEI